MNTEILDMRGTCFDGEHLIVVDYSKEVNDIGYLTAYLTEDVCKQEQGRIGIEWAITQNIN